MILGIHFLTYKIILVKTTTPCKIIGKIMNQMMKINYKLI
jgi:hypothetical protein